MNGRPVAGVVSPLAGLGFGDALWNFEFWNNIRDASGMVYWGEQLGMPELKERGQRVINLALEAPQNEAGRMVDPAVWDASASGTSPPPTAAPDPADASAPDGFEAGFEATAKALRA